LLSRRYALIIPALNEAGSIGELLRLVPKGLFSQLIAVDNGSQDDTGAVAKAAGAEVIVEPRRGYGQACRAGLANISPDTSAVVFMDADLSDDPGDLHRLVRRFEEGRFDLVIGSRVLGNREAGSLTALQRFGNWLTTNLIRWIWGVSFTDLGPMRMVSRGALDRMVVKDPNFGWNVEMQARAAQLRLAVAELPVHYRKRHSGKSKISGTVSKSFLAGCKILWTVYRCWRSAPERRETPAPMGA
jgi:glycosyltransferase involved in cell wall biosynthesis